MSDILLTHSYHLRFDPKQWRAQQPYPPLGSMYAASALREDGRSVSLYDPMFAADSSGFRQALIAERPRVVVIYDDGFNYLTKMCLTNMREAAFEMARIASEQGATVIVSGSDATDHSADYLANRVRYVIVGEGEITLKETVAFLLDGEGSHDMIHGLRYQQGEEVLASSPRSNLKELENLPLPAWDLVDLSEYRRRWLKSSGYFSVNIVTTRGCPFKCNWCAKPIYGNRYNARSPENVIAEIKMLQSLVPFDHIWFCDDIFGLKPGWVKRFANLVEEDGLRFRFKIQSRADLLLEDDSIADLARAGADEVWIGAESGSQKVLDAMDKGTTVEQISRSTRIMKKHGIKPCYFLQFGYPGEEMEDIHLTTRLLFNEMPHDIGISVSYPLPGTKFYERVKSELTEKQNWTDSDELLVMFNSPYPAGFYKKLQRHVHYEFRKRQALNRVGRMSSVDDLTMQASLLYRIPMSLFSKAQLRKYAFDA